MKTQSKRPVCDSLFPEPLLGKSFRNGPDQRSPTNIRTHLLAQRRASYYDVLELEGEELGP